MRAMWQIAWILMCAAVLCLGGCKGAGSGEEGKAEEGSSAEAPGPGKMKPAEDSDENRESSRAGKPHEGANAKRGDEPVGESSRTQETETQPEASSTGPKGWRWQRGSQALSPQPMEISPEPLSVMHGALFYEARFASDGSEFGTRMGPVLSGSETDIHGQITGYGVFDTDTLELKRSFELPDDAGTPLAHAVNGGVLAVTAGQELLIWAEEASKPLRVKSKEKRLSYVAVEEAGRRVLARMIGAPSYLLLHDLETSETVTLEKCNRVGTMLFVKGGVLCSAEADEQLTVLVDYNGELRATLEGKVLAVSPDGERALVRRGSVLNGEVSEVSLPSGEPTDRFQKMPGEIERVTGTEQGWLVDSGHQAPTSIVHYTTEGPRPYPARRGRMHPVHELAMHGDSVVYEYDFGIEKFDGAGRVDGESHINPGGAISFGADGGLLSQPSGKGVMPIQHWDADTGSFREVVSYPDAMESDGQPRTWMPLARRASGESVPTSEHGQVVFAGNGDGPLLVLDSSKGNGVWHLVDPGTDAVVANLSLPTAFLTTLGRLSAIADSGDALVTSNGQVVTVISMSSGEERCRYVLNRPPRSVQLSPGGSLIAVWDGSNTFIHDGNTCRPIMDGDSAPVVALPEPTAFGETSVKLVEPQVVFVDDEYLIATMKDFDMSHLLRWDGEQLVHEGNTSMDKQFPEGAARSADGRLAVSYPGAILVWELDQVVGANLGQ